MTLLDLCRLIKRYWYIVVVIPLACALICGFVVSSKEDQPQTSYTAKSTIVANSQAATVVGIALNNASEAVAANPGVSATAAISSGTTNIVVSVVAQNEGLARSLVEAISEDTVAQAQELFAGNGQERLQVEFSAMIYDTTVSSTVAESQGKSDLLKYILLALVAGLFVGICIVVIIDLVRRPIISAEGMQDATELPVLASYPFKDDGSRLLANIRFAAKRNDLTTICLIPLGTTDLSAHIKDSLESAFESCKEGTESLDISVCEPLDVSMAGAYAAQDAQATVVVVQQWSDSFKQLESTLAELHLADAHTVGTVYVSSKLKDRN